jgi:septum formation protein
VTIVLASGSEVRRTLLANAGVPFDVTPAALDERAAEQPLLETGASVEDIALALAMAKAVAVSEKRPEAIVIGADQMLELDGERLTKPTDMEAARRQLLRLSGRMHRLHSTVACARGGQIMWDHVESPRLTMRKLDPAEIGRYLAAAGPTVLASVGVYQLEGLGVRLFDRIEGDYFAILGLPLLPLLKFLRAERAIE